MDNENSLDEKYSELKKCSFCGKKLDYGRVYQPC